MEQLLIGICGNARSGKDTFGNALAAVLDGRVHAYAKALKCEIEDELMTKHGLDVWTNDDEEKKKVRPHLIEAGTKAKIGNPNFWLDKLNEGLYKTKPNIITDIRFQNELDDVIAQGGYIFYLERMHEGEIIPPGSDAEADGNPFLRMQADYIVCWETGTDPIPFVQNLILTESKLNH